VLASACAIGFTLVTVACGVTTRSTGAPSCPRRGPVVLASQTDIARVAHCTTLPGVTVRSGAPLDTSALRSLTTIAGDLTIGPTVGIHEIAIGELRTVEGTIRASNNGLLQGLFLPKLDRAGRIDIDGNVALTTISLPRLAAVHGALHITDNASLEAVDMPVLRVIDHDLVLAGDPQLTLLDASQLERAASARVALPKLAPEVVDRLRAVAAAP
jgi:hypothetical protein